MPNNNKEQEITLERIPIDIWDRILTYLNNSEIANLRVTSKNLKEKVDSVPLIASFRVLKTIEEYQKTSVTKKLASIKLSAELTDHLFPSPRNRISPHSFKVKRGNPPPKPSDVTNAIASFSFFDEINKRFPRVKKIYLELQHLYMLQTLIHDPQFLEKYTLINVSII